MEGAADGAAVNQICPVLFVRLLDVSFVEFGWAVCLRAAKEISVAELVDVPGASVKYVRGLFIIRSEIAVAVAMRVSGFEHA